MQLIPSRFITAAFALMVVFGLAHLFYYLRFKRKANVTLVDTELWQLRLFSAFLGALLFVALFYLPGTGYYDKIDMSPSAREAAFQTLVDNQRRIGSELAQLRDILNGVFMVAGIYLFAIGASIARVWADKQKRGANNDPNVQKPLGLET